MRSHVLYCAHAEVSFVCDHQRKGVGLIHGKKGEVGVAIATEEGVRRRWRGVRPWG